MAARSNTTASGAPSVTQMESRELVRLITEFATAFVTKNPTRVEDIPTVFETALNAALSMVQRLPADGVSFGMTLGTSPVAADLSTGAANAQQTALAPFDGKGPTQKPAVAPAESIHDDYIICLEDGRRMRTLKKHLAAKFGLTPTQYRVKWGLPLDYPMACPAYSRNRQMLASQNKQKLTEARARARARA